MTRQISLPFDWRGDDSARSAGDGVLLGEANRIALAHLERWRDWPLAVSILTGPPRSGRSTLGRHFAAMSGGSVIDEAQGADEHALFHAWNAAQTERKPLLLIGHEAPSRWAVALPDLRSRLAAAPHVELAEPDEALGKALIERSYSAIEAATRLLDAAALSSGRKISIALAKETLQSAGLLPIVPSDPPS
jgi:hypothetical protein